MPTKTGNVLSWASDLDDATLAQAQRVADLPFVEGHLALMPDAHLGYGATIGSVIPTKGAVIPYAVGVDIGCGMIATKLPITSQGLPDDLSELHSDIAQAVPSGVGKGFDINDVDSKHFPGRANPLLSNQSLFEKAWCQFGTLGSGNHFVEVCLDENDGVWVVLHSGSRGIGNNLATQHIETAKGLMRQYFIELDDPNLAYLVEGTPEFDAYIRDLLWAQDYAAGNRQAMLDAVFLALFKVIPFSFESLAAIDTAINCHHNYTAQEHHNGKNLWVTRKGAIRAREGDLGVIPGSMGTGTYIVSGLGNPSSYNSCSHGAGRKLSRGQAKKTLSIESLKERMEGKVWNESQAEKLLDESPDAYKDIETVMQDQADLVRVEHHLTQILNYKGV